MRRTYYDAEPWYQREGTKDWYQQMVPTNERFTEILDTFIRFASSKIVEVACGGGWLGEHLLARGPREYLGMDFAETAVRNSQERLTSSPFNKGNAKAVRADALLRTSYPNDVDVIIAHQFPHCLIGDDRAKWFGVCKDVLAKKQGLLILSCMYGIPDSLADSIDPETKINTAGNRYYADLDEIRENVATAGFTINDQEIPQEHVVIIVAKAG